MTAAGWGNRRLAGRVAGVVLICLALNASAAAYPNYDSQKSAEVIFWATSNIKKLNADLDWANHAPKSPAPVPPVVDFPCHLCGDNTPTQGEAQVAAWVTASENPEVAKAAELTAIAHQAGLYQQLPAGTLTPAAEKALGQFNESAINQALAAIGNRLMQKSYEMAKSYDKNSKMAYAGIMFLLKAGRDGILLVAFQSGSSQSDSQTMQYVSTWTASIVDDIETKVLSGHQYNLCPVYAELYRDTELLGGPSTNMDQFQKTIEKMDKLMTFNVNMNLKVTTVGSDGSHLNATWTGKAKMKLDLDLGHSCYTPKWENGGQMSVNVASWDMVSIDHQANGGTRQIPVTLSSSHQYMATIKQPPQVTLCDPQPLFQAPLAGMTVPQEEVTALGHTQKTTLLLSFLSSVIAANEVNSSATNAVTGGAPSVPGAASSSSSSSSSTAAMDQDKAQIEAHKSDVGWLMGPAGQAVIADMQKRALAQAQGSMASAGVVVPQANNFSQLSSSMNSVHLNWTNGQAEPVNQTIHVTKDGATWDLTVTVQQAQQ